MSRIVGISLFLFFVVAQAAPRFRPMTTGVHPGSVSWMGHRNEAAAKPSLKYYGGPVLANVRVVSVFWGTDVDKTVKAQIGDFYDTLINSSMMTWLNEYNTDITGVNGKPGTNQKIGYGKFAGDYTITPANTNKSITDTDVQAEIQKQIEANNLPAPDDNSLYMVHFPSGITITFDDGTNKYTSCQDFCAYHGSYHAPDKQNVFYGVMPDFTGGTCSFGCGSGSNFQNFTSAASHEIIEAVTDAQVGDIGSTFAYPGAWYDITLDQEIGDLCAYKGTGTIKSTNGTNYTIQGEWSNKRNMCAYTP